MNDEPQFRLARDIHRVLQALPDRPAPAALEERVRAEIARRAAQPWWRQSFTHWPAAAKGVFLILSAGVAVSMVLALAHVLHIRLVGK